MRDLKERAQRAKGLNSPAVMKDAQPGAVYTVEDQAIALPESRLPSAGARQFHKERYVIVLQASALCRAADPRTIIVVPCSSSSRTVGAADYQVPAGEVAFPEATVAYAGLVQPILKSELRAHKGNLSPATLLALQAVVLRTMGLLGQTSVAAPPL